MSLQINGHSTVPPGFRFHPTDEELVGYYLQNKVACKRIDLDVIKEIDLYKLEPWDLQEKCRIGSGEQNDWYFFSHKDKKYPTGTRTNRATTAGFWKATGRDKAIFTKFKLIGMRKTLVFYKGRAPNGQKSDWIMHEYRLEDDINNTSSNEEGWVVCRVFRKRNIVKQPRDYDVGYEEPPMRLLPELESVENFGTCSIFYNQMLNCKQEHMNLNCYNSLNESLPQLPSLESPKNSHTNASAAAMALLLQESSSLASFPALHTPAGMEDQQRMLVPHEDQFHGFHEELVTEWSVIDRVVSELNHNEEAKEIRPSTSDSLADMTMMLRFKHPADYLYGNDVDLWSYNQAQP